MLDEETNVFIGEDEIIKLTKPEGRILSFLIENKHRCNSAKLIARETGYAVATVRLIIYDLRMKLRKYISITIRGYDIGYLIQYIGDTNDNKNTTNDKTKEK